MRGATGFIGSVFSSLQLPAKRDDTNFVRDLPQTGSHQTGMLGMPADFCKFVDTQKSSQLYFLGLG
jgi:hypothetical protein